MYPPGLIVTAGQVCIAVLVALSYPLQLHPCRASLTKVISCLPDSNLLKHTLITAFIIAASWSVAVNVADLSFILGLVGATGSTIICYILPGFLYFRIGTQLLRWIGVAQSLFGVCFMVVCVGLQVNKL